jgi:hypothetical protein
MLKRGGKQSEAISDEYRLDLSIITSDPATSHAVQREGGGRRDEGGEGREEGGSRIQKIGEKRRREKGGQEFSIAT